MKSKTLISEVIKEIESSSNYTDLIYLRSRIEDVKNVIEKKMEAMRSIAKGKTIIVLLLGLLFPSIASAQQSVSIQDIEKYAERGGVIIHVDPQGRETYEGHPDSIATHKRIQALTYVNEKGEKQGFGDHKGNLITKEEYMDQVKRDVDSVNDLHLQQLSHNHSKKERDLKEGDAGYISPELIKENDEAILQGCESASNQAQETIDQVNSFQPAFTSFEGN